MKPPDAPEANPAMTSAAAAAARSTSFWAHTAEDEQGNRLPESCGNWQPLHVHLKNVARLARRFAEPLGLAEEAELAGLLHDL